MADASLLPGRATWRALCAVSLAYACSTDTGALARREPAAGGQAGHSGATSAGAAGVAAGGGAPGVGGSTGTQGGVSGAGALSVVHGVVDGGRLFICLRRASGEPAFPAEPPEPVGGLAFGGVHRLALDWDVSAEEVEAALFAATAPQIEGLTCADLVASDQTGVPGAAPDAGLPDAGDAGTPGLPFPTEPLVPRRAGSVAFAAGALQVGTSYVLVAAGCATLGVQPSTEICGDADPFGSYQSLILVEHRQQAVDAELDLGLQFLSASRAVGRASVVLQGESQRQPVRLATDVQFGAVRPQAPATVEEPAGIELHVDGANRADYTQLWSDTLASAGVEAFELRGSHILAYVGPKPNVAADAGFAPARFVLLPGSRD